jgi:hypothetical protein
MAVPYKLNYFEIETGIDSTSTLIHSGDLTANKIIKIGGTSNDILLGDGTTALLSGLQPTGNYITALTGEATATGPGSVAITLTNSAVIGKLLTGLSITGSTIAATDTILQAFGKVQNQINGKQDAITLTTTGTSGAATLIANTLNIPQYTDAFVGTVTSVSALTLGTTGTDLSSTVANGTTTPVITLNVPTASATNRGALSSTDWTTFNSKQDAGNYITSLTGEATASGPGAASVTLSNTAVIGKVLTGLNVTGGTVISTDSILAAFGKVQNQINGLVGGSIFQGTWDASTNTPALASSVGTNGYYYIVSVDGSTNLNGITDWKVGDWAIFAGTTWQKVDNTDSVASVNGYTGTVSLVTGDVLEGAGSLPSRPSQLYFTDARARAAISLTTSGSSGASTYDSATGVLNIPNYLQDLSGYVTLNTAQTITAAKTFSTSGNSDTLIINHSSGSGIALNITKGGNGEGIYVNKTSGSGNAVTIIGTLNATTLVKSGGTSSEFLKADGTVDSTSYGTGSVTSVAALTLGTTGTDLSSTVANGTTTPVITLNVPTASATNRGALSSADWTTFNGKQAALSGTGIVKSTAGVISYLTDPLPIANGGTGSSTQNFVDLTTTQTIGGFKTFSNTIKLDNGTSNAFLFESGTTGFYMTLKAAAGLTTDIIVTLPSVTGTLALTSAIPANPVGGTGTTNTLPKFTGASTIGDSAITDDGTTVTLVSRALSGTSATFSGDTTVGASNTSGIFTIGNRSGNNFGLLKFAASNTGTNWIITSNAYVGSSLQFTPSTTSGGDTYTTPAMTLTSGGDLQLASGVATFNRSGKKIELNANSANANVDAEIEITSGMNLFFKLGGSERFRIASTGAATFSSGIGIGGATPSTGGIQFPATQVAIANANNLDDYEEGTWTPGIKFGASTAGITYSSQAGTYTKIGRQVTVNGFFILSNKGAAAGAASITGLPFTIANTSGNYSVLSLRFNVITYTGQITGLALINDTAIGLEQTTEAGVLSDILNTNIANNSSIVLSLTYFV